MAQTIANIKKEITDNFIANPTIVERYNITPGNTFEDEFSSVSIESILFDVVAFCVWSLQKLMDAFRVETEETIKNTRPAYIPWLLSKAKDFQYGFDLIPDDVDYDNTGIDPSVIEASKVVKYAAIIELRRGLRVKVATEINGDLSPLPTVQADAFKAYFKRIKPFCPIRFVNEEADRLKLSLKIYYNPLVLNGTGARLDGAASTPIRDAVVSFLKQTDFNSLFVLSELIVALRAVGGVVIPHISEAQAKYGNIDYQEIESFYLPDSGYLRIYDLVNDLQIEYIPHDPI